MDFFVTDQPEREHVDLIDAGLDEYNLAKAGVVDQRKLAVLARAPDTGKVVGGLIARTSLGLLFVELFYVPAEYRGSGLGAQLLATAEREAVSRGCSTGVVYTINFQAPDFYVKQGWQVFGEVPTDNGLSRIFLSQALA
jgi:GNAT superfamily N-acetyltransferase